MHELHLKTSKTGMYDLTGEIQKYVSDQSVRQGICFVFCPHTTAAITINENADPDVQSDILHGLDKISPDLKEFMHMEGNSAAHIKSSIVGASEMVAIENGRLVLGTWQGIYFCEFDGPRSRKVYITIQ